LQKADLKSQTSAADHLFYERITPNGGPTGRADWRAVFPITKHEFSTGRRAIRDHHCPMSSEISDLQNV